MPYKTIVLGLIEQRPELHERLRRSRTILRAMDQFAIELKESHEIWKQELSLPRPCSDPIQIAGEAMEIAVAELEARLASASRLNESDTFSLDEAMTHISRHTPSA